MTTPTETAASSCDLTLVVPCYNEETVLDRTVPPLVECFRSDLPAFEIVLVNNGSTDGTQAVIDRLCRAHGPVRAVQLDVNCGYGAGVLAGYRAALGRCVGHIPADGPVRPSDVVALARRAIELGPDCLVSAVRRDRQDTAVRRLVSRSYNLLFRVLFGAVSPDINGTPKFLWAADWARLQVSTTDYFLEAEMMLRARAIGLRIELVPVDSQPRPAGRSKVSVRLVSSCLEFLGNMVYQWFRQAHAPGTGGASLKVGAVVEHSEILRSDR